MAVASVRSGTPFSMDVDSLNASRGPDPNKLREPFYVNSAIDNNDRCVKAVLLLIFTKHDILYA